MSAAVTAWTFQQGQQLDSYRVLGTEPVEVDGRKGVRIDYAYVSEPVFSPYRKALPVVGEAVDYLFPGGDGTIIITTAADGMHFGEGSRQFDAILGSVSFAGK